MADKMRKLLLLLMAVPALWAQVGQSVNQVSGPPPTAWVSLFFYNGSNQVTSICYAFQSAQATTFSVGGVPAITNIVVSSNTATATFGATAQFWVGQQVTVAGSATTALNGTYKVLTVSGSTITFTTSGVSNGTYTDMTLATSEPLLNALLWSIQIFNYTSSNVTQIYWGGNPQGQTVPQGLACSNRGNY